MNIGYARVSTEEQNGNGQVTELKKVCDRVELEYASGGRWDRPCLQNILRGIKAGDVLVVWKLDRLGRSLPHLLTTVTDLKDRGIAFRSLTEQMDTTTPQGELLFHIFGALAQLERSLIQERVQAGLAAARRRGRRGGRPVVIDAEKLAAVVAALDGGATKAAVCRTFGVRRSTLFDSLARIGWSPGLTGSGGTSVTTAAIERNPDRGAVRAADGTA